MSMERMIESNRSRYPAGMYTRGVRLMTRAGKLRAKRRREAIRPLAEWMLSCQGERITEEKERARRAKQEEQKTRRERIVKARAKRKAENDHRRIMAGL